jgi:hypothetical protein
VGNLIKSLSYKTEDAAIMEELHKIAVREDRSDSFVMMEALREYAKAHGKGNDSYQLEHFAKGGVALPSVWKELGFDDLKGYSWKDDDDMLSRIKRAEEVIRRDRQTKRDSEMHEKGLRGR